MIVSYGISLHAHIKICEIMTLSREALKILVLPHGMDETAW